MTTNKRFDTAEKILTDLVLEGMSTELECMRDDISELVEDGQLDKEEAKTLLESDYELRLTLNTTIATLRFGEHTYNILVAKLH